MKPVRRCSAILMLGLLGGLVLLLLWGNSLVWGNGFTARSPATWHVELRAGILSMDWVKAPEWFEARYWRRDLGWTCERIPSGSRLWEGPRWMPQPYHMERGPVSHLYPYHAGVPATGPSTLDHHRLQIPIWQILTLHIALIWVALVLRQRHQRREWERQQAAGDPQLLEPS